MGKTEVLVISVNKARCQIQWEKIPGSYSVCKANAVVTLSNNGPSGQSTKFFVQAVHSSVIGYKISAWVKLNCTVSAW